MKTSLAQEAINKALLGLWEEAGEINKKILKTNFDDVEALNRLAKCYSETGKLSEAKKTAIQVLSIDPSNSIALKCLEKYKVVASKNNKKPNNNSIITKNFIEEPGKTKIIYLVNLGDKKTLSQLEVGQEVRLMTHTHKVSVVDNQNKYIGRLPDNIAARIKTLIKFGNKYECFVKFSDLLQVSIFIKEVERKSNDSSFPTEKIEYVPYTRTELIQNNALTEDSEF